MIKLLYTTKLDAATLTSKTAATGYAASNVQSRFLKQTWRSTGLSNEWLKFDLGSSSAINSFCMFANNLTSGATITLYGHASDLGNTEAAWTGTASLQISFGSQFDQRAAYLNVGSQSYRWWLLAISDASNSNGYIEVGRVYAGVPISPTLNFNENFTEVNVDPSVQMWTEGQHLYSTSRLDYKTFDFQFLDLARADQITLRNFWKTVKKTEPFVLILDDQVEPVEFTRYGVLTSDLNIQGTVNLRANLGFQFRELR